jgi:hypothetical protein
MLNVIFLTQYLGQISFKFWFQTLSGIKNGFLQLTPVAELFVCHHKETQVNATVTIITHSFLQQHDKSPYECTTDPTISFSIHVKLDIYTIYSKVEIRHHCTKI